MFNIQNLKQKIFDVGHKEPEEFKLKRKQCYAMKDDLQKAKQGVEVWVKGAKDLSDAAKQLATLASTSSSAQVNAGDQVLAEVSDEISAQFGPEKAMQECQTIVDSITEKIKAIDKLKSQVNNLGERRIARDRFKRKLEDAEKKDDQAKKDTLRREYEEANAAFEGLNAEIEATFDFLIKESNGQGGFGLARPEMAEFKMSAKKTFANCHEKCEKLIKDTEFGDLRNELTAFMNRRDDEVNSRRANVQQSLGVAVGFATPIAESVTTAGTSPPPPPPPESAAMGQSTRNFGNFGSQSNLGAAGSQRQMDYNSQQSYRGAPQSARPAPPPPPPPNQSAATTYPKARALYAYSPQNQDELELAEGDIIQVISKEDDGWWQGVLPNGSKGLFPSNYVEEIKYDDEGDDYEETGAV